MLLTQKSRVTERICCGGLPSQGVGSMISYSESLYSVLLMLWTDGLSHSPWKKHRRRCKT